MVESECAGLTSYLLLARPRWLRRRAPRKIWRGGTALADDAVRRFVGNAEIRKRIYVKGRLLNLVVAGS